MITKVLIVDDHAIVREGLKQILGDTPDIFIIGEASDGADALAKVRGEKWDIVLLDMTMPGRSGLETLRQIKKERPALPILIFSMHPEDHYATRALKSGAAGYLTKSCPPEELVGALTKVARGGKYITHTLAEKLAGSLESDLQKQPHEVLTNREFQVLNMLASGKTVSEVARELGLSVKTVSTHRAKILSKMEMRNNAELMHYVMKNNLLLEEIDSPSAE